MARLSKAHQFTIYQDSGTTARASPHRDPPENATQQETGQFKKSSTSQDQGDSSESRQPEVATEELWDDEEYNALMDVVIPDNDEDGDADDERRESELTVASVSTMPESAWQTDNEYMVSVHPSHMSPMNRTPFRRAGSVQRMRMASPTPSEYSQRRSVISHSRQGIPRSSRTRSKGTPIARKHLHQDSEAQSGEKEYPLVLLHVTLLPVDLRWSTKCLQELGPAHLLENLKLLRMKVSETILQRGILIPHPREDFELLEERLLEALELKEERVTKCGHFRPRDSIDSRSSAECGEMNSDSGVGSCTGFSDAELCNTCNHRVKTARLGVGSGTKRWTIKVFAANGLMRAPTWAAAWSEMERVDVEILPLISDDLRQQLDAWMDEEELNHHLRQEEETTIDGVFEAPIPVCREYEMVTNEDRRTGIFDVMVNSCTTAGLEAGNLDAANVTDGPTQDVKNRALTNPQDLSSKFPQVYQAADIPAPVLLKNYLYLLACDKGNLSIVVVTIVILWVSIKAAGFNGSVPDSSTLNMWNYTNSGSGSPANALELHHVGSESDLSKNNTLLVTPYTTKDDIPATPEDDMSSKLMPQTNQVLDAIIGP